VLLPRVLRTPDWFFNTVMLPLQSVSPSARLSMSADYDAGRTTEVRDLNGAVSTAGKENGVLTPVNDALVRLIEDRWGHLDSKQLLAALGL
jgi:2-dehydropantoate 2-reductase